MDEQTFLEKFQIWCYNNFNPQATDIETFNKIMKECARSFLIEHHKEYRKVYWYTRDEKIQDQIRQQIRIKLNEFLDFLPFKVDEEYKEVMIDSYITHFSQ
jgi:hypothetical protein